MARQKKTTFATSAPTPTTQVGHDETPKPINSAIENFEGWSKLAPNEQSIIREETGLIEEGLQLEGQGKVQVGEHLTKMQLILGPKRMFVRFLDHRFKMSRATAYRYMEEFRTGTRLLPQPLLQRAMVRRVAIREKVIAQNPPPKTSNLIEMDRYLDKISSIPVTTHSAVTSDPNVLLKECLNFVGIRDARVTGNWKTKATWRRNLVGMLMTKFEMETPITFNPIPVPEDFAVTRGRPKQEQSPTQPAVA